MKRALSKDELKDKYNKMVLDYMKEHSTNNICDTQIKTIIYELHLYRNAVFHAIEELVYMKKIKKIGLPKYGLSKYEICQ